MPQLAEKIRQKYPNLYDDLDDDELEAKVLEKHPQYQDLVEETPKKKSVFSKPEPFKPAGEDNIITKAVRLISPGYGKKASDKSYTAEQAQKESGSVVSKMYNKNPDEEPTLLPKRKTEPDTFWGGFGNSLYESFIRPQTSVEGIAGNIGFGMVGGIEKAAAKIPKELAVREAIPKVPSEYPSVRRSSEVPYKFNGNLPKVEEPPIRAPRDLFKSPNEAALAEETIGKQIAAHRAEEQAKIRGTEADIPDNPAARAMERARLGLSEEKPTATFKGMQETGDPANPTIPLFDIQGGEASGSTVSLEGLAKHGIEVPEYNISEIPKSGAQLREEALAAREVKKPFVSPFEKDKVTPIEDKALIGQEGELGPHNDMPPERLIQSVINGDKPAAILDNLPENKRDSLVKYAKDNGLEVIDNPIVPEEPILAKDKATGEALVESLKNGDHETNGKLLGYSPEDIETFRKKINETTGVNEIPSNLHPQLTALKNHGDGVLSLEFDRTKDISPEDVKKLFPGKNVEVTEMASGKDSSKSFRIDMIGKDDVERASLGDEIERSVGGAFDDTIEMQAGNKPPKAKITPTSGPAGQALDKLFNALGKVKENRVSQDIINKRETARRFAAFGDVKDEGVKGAKKQLSTLKGEFEKVDQDKLLLGRKEADSLFTAVKQAKITNGEKARGYTALFKLLNGEGVPQRNELAILDDVFGAGFSSRIVEMHGGIGAVGLKLAKTANTMKAMKSSIDLSAPLRQGIGLIHRPEYREAFKNMFKYFGDKEFFESSIKAIEDDVDYINSREAGLFLAKSESITVSEEAFANSYVHNIPGKLKAPFKASERAYTGFLNELRFKTFKNLIKNAEAAGNEVFSKTKLKDKSGSFILDEQGNVQTTNVPTKLAEDIANYINVSTGRGKLGSLEKIAPELNTVLWSPRLISSRLSILNPKYYIKMDSFACKEAIKSLFAIAATGSTLTGLGVLAGGKTSFDSTSSDFMKARFGKNVLDPFAGFQQLIVAAMRMISESHRMASGTKRPFNKPGIPEIGANFMINKLSPAAALAYDIASARNFTGGGDYVSRFGEKKNVSSEVAKSFVPMFTQDIYDVFKNDPSFAEQVGLDTLALFGAGVQDYPEKKKSVFKKMSVR